MRNRKNRKPNANCPAEGVMMHLGGKWKLSIIWHLSRADHFRYGELRRLIPNITERIFILQLKEMQESGLLKRKDYGEVPPRVEYSLTKLAKELLPIIESLGKWAQKNGFDEDKIIFHD